MKLMLNDVELNALASELDEFLSANWQSFINDAKEYNGLEITFATNDEATRWNFQTGDNSYHGNCYSLPHWAVTTITEDSTIEGIILDVIGQWEELLPERC